MIPVFVCGDSFGCWRFSSLETTMQLTLRNADLSDAHYDKSSEGGFTPTDNILPEH